MILLKIKTLFGFPIKLLKTQRAVRICGKPRLCDFFRIFGKRSPTPRIRPHPRQDFSTWIKNRIADYDFVENQDFVKLHKKVELSKTGQVAIEYFITLDMAKDVATVLGYSDATNAIKQHCKGVAKHHPIADRMGR